MKVGAWVKQQVNSGLERRCWLMSLYCTLRAHAASSRNLFPCVPAGHAQLVDVAPGFPFGRAVCLCCGHPGHGPLVHARPAHQPHDCNRRCATRLQRNSGLSWACSYARGMAWHGRSGEQGGQCLQAAPRLSGPPSAGHGSPMETRKIALGGIEGAVPLAERTQAAGLFQQACLTATSAARDCPPRQQSSRRDRRQAS